MAQRLSFNQWKRQVDERLVQLCQMNSDDLPDYRYRDAYDYGETVNVTARKALAAAKKDMGL